MHSFTFCIRIWQLQFTCFLGLPARCRVRLFLLLDLLDFGALLGCRRTEDASGALPVLNEILDVFVRILECLEPKWMVTKSKLINTRG